MENMTETDNINDKRDEATERFSIKDESSANWYLGKLANIEAEKTRLKAQAAQRLAELDADAKSLRGRFESELRAWARTEADRRKRQGVTLLQGTIKFTAYKGGVKIVDQAAALAHARAALPELITTEEITETKETFDADAYLKKQANPETGELLPGLDSFPAGENFSVSFPKPKGETTE